MAIATKITRASPITHVLCFAHPARAHPKLTTAWPIQLTATSLNHPSNHHNHILTMVAYPSSKFHNKTQPSRRCTCNYKAQPRPPRLRSIQLYLEAASTAAPTWCRASAQP
ncbi:hypothetical protein M0R45_001872 [Rubus argutus]|uniref:Uncharacterized protein n=1 Tax=Rubus argutus TaxID=59490 RepID=A0AAW1VK90_RUBAR